jgi:exosome complex component MTR3
MNVTDRRRICGPASAKPLVFGALPANIQSKRKVDLNREDDIEAQISRTFIKTNLISNANGSSYIELDGNIVSVSVYGPRPIRGSFMDKAGLSVTLDDVGDVMDDLMKKKFCNYIENSFMGVINLDKYPKSGIDIFVNVISVQNVEELYLKLLSIISDATTLALIDAKIEVLDIVTTGFDSFNNTVMSYVKNDELVGILCESLNPLDNLKDIMERTQKKAALMKSAIVSYLLESTQKKQ